MPPKKSSTKAPKTNKAADEAPSAPAVPECFAGKDFYGVLGISKTATVEEISKAYKGMSLKHHPDRNNSPTATEEFQYLARIHETLAKDPRKRALYDKHGDAALTDHSDGFFDAYEYWRSVFPTLSTNDVDAFEVTYVGSNDEKDDVIDAWNECKGDFAKMMTAHLLFASTASLPRHTQLVKDLLAEGRLDKKYEPAFEKSLKTVARKLAAYEAEEERKLAAQKEEEAKGEGKKGKKPDMAALMAMLMASKGGKESMFDAIASKYGDASKKGGKGEAKGSKGKDKGKVEQQQEEEDEDDDVNEDEVDIDSSDDLSALFEGDEGDFEGDFEGDYEGDEGDFEGDVGAVDEDDEEGRLSGSDSEEEEEEEEEEPVPKSKRARSTPAASAAGEKKGGEKSDKDSKSEKKKKAAAAAAVAFAAIHAKALAAASVAAEASAVRTKKGGAAATAPAATNEKGGKKGRGLGLGRLEDPVQTKKAFKVDFSSLGRK